MDGLQENGNIQKKITIFVKNQYLKKNLQIINFFVGMVSHFYYRLILIEKVLIKGIFIS